MVDDTLVLMQGDLKKALPKPANERHRAIVIDLKKCVGCQVFKHGGIK